MKLVVEMKTSRQPSIFQTLNEIGDFNKKEEEDGPISVKVIWVMWRGTKRKKATL